MSADQVQAVALLQRILGAEPLRPSAGAVDEQEGDRRAEEQHRDRDSAGCYEEHDDDAGQAPEGDPTPGMPPYRVDSHVRSVPRREPATRARACSLGSGDRTTGAG